MHRIAKQVSVFTAVTAHELKDLSISLSLSVDEVISYLKKMNEIGLIRAVFDEVREREKERE